MAWRSKPPQTLAQRLEKVMKAGLNPESKIMIPQSGIISEEDQIESIDTRIRKILDITDNHHKSKYNMLFFVMYDIESNKVRNQIVKYLIRSGCHRIQKSIFLADLSSEAFNKIKSDLAEVQSYYDNHDSILLVPISTDYLQAMKVIGQSINIDIITRNKNTLFF